jgi:hypothetical protein
VRGRKKGRERDEKERAINIKREEALDIDK